jgi:type IV pilus assembly protein PilQ
MKRNLSRIFMVFVVIAWIAAYITGYSFAAVSADDSKAPENKMGTDTANLGNLESVLFAKLPGKERVHLVVSKQPLVDVKSKVNGSYLIKLEDMLVPENLRRFLGEGELSNIVSVLPSEKVIEGKHWVYLNVTANKIVPYSIRQEGPNILIDFNISALEEKKVSDSPRPVTRKVVTKVSAEPDANVSDVKKDDAGVPANREIAKKYTDRIISLDFQDADIKSVLRLMAEYGNISIVSSDEVKGSITLTMKNVPWTRALDTILDVNSLSKRQEGNVIVVTTLAKRKQDDDAKMKAIDDENARKIKKHDEMAAKGLLKQVLIEAKIVEATESFIRNIGVQWGFGNQQKISGGTYGLGITGGSNPSNANAYSQGYPSEIPITPTKYMAAVNFPSVVSSPAIGLVFGGATGFLETQLAALETNGTGKLISSPKVVTMEGIKAIIKQGAEVPYTTPASGTSPATVSFKEALLKLEVTPQITDEGKISMDISASNDSPDYANEVQGNPPIKKSEVQSKVVISDGDTIVIGGVMTADEEKQDSGWPFLQHIPVLGWLFKTQKYSDTKKQLLIFVTPKILKGDKSTESSEKIINP